MSIAESIFNSWLVVWLCLRKDESLILS